MKQTIGIILVIAALAFGYFGYTKMENSKAGIKIGDLEISASDKSSNNEAYILIALGAVSLIGGFVMLSKGKT
jgi:hypothetical protein